MRAGRPRSFPGKRQKPCLCAGRIEEVNRFVGKPEIGEIADRPLNGGGNCPVRYLDSVMFLHAGADAAQDFQCLLWGRFLDIHLLKPAFEGCVLLDVKAVFRDGRRSDNADLPTGEGGFQDIRRIHRAPGLSGTHQCVNLVQKEDDVGIRRSFLDDRLHAFLELPTIFCPGANRWP
jgi:hypothetical protein